MTQQGAGVQCEGGKGGETTKQPGEKEGPCLGRKMKGLCHAPAEANKKGADHIDRQDTKGKGVRQRMLNPRGHAKSQARSDCSS